VKNERISSVKGLDSTPEKGRKKIPASSSTFIIHGKNCNFLLLLSLGYAMQEAGTLGLKNRTNPFNPSKRYAFSL